jgi:hypothetical protein
MRVLTHPGLQIKGPVVAWFFYEHKCPICRFVHMTVLLPLQAEGVIDVRPFEVIDNDGLPEMMWFHRYSDNMGGAITPTIRLVDIYAKEIDYRYAPIQVLHLWDTKKSKYVEESDIVKAKVLHNHIIEAVKKYRRKMIRETHDLSLDAQIQIPQLRTKNIYWKPPYTQPVSDQGGV